MKSIFLKVNNSPSAASQISCLGWFPRFAQDNVRGVTTQRLYDVQLVNVRNNLSGEKNVYRLNSVV